MKIVIATPLYPPEIATSARYIKELATRMAKEHELTIVTYAHLPEKIAGVNILTVNKRLLLPLRLIAYTLLLWKTACANQLIYAENGAAIELPVGIVALFMRRPLVVHMGDLRAHEKASENWLLGKIEKFMCAQAKKIFSDIPPECPEILPFEPIPTEKISSYNASWDSHVEELNKIFLHYD